MDLLSWSFASETADIDKPLLVDATDPSRTLSFRQMRSLVRKVISGFHAAGIGPGDCVCVSSFNDIYYNVVYLGIIGCGARFTGTNPAYTSHEMVHHLRMTGATVMIAEPKLLDVALSAAKECEFPESRVYVLDIHETNPRDDLSSWNTLLQHGEKDWEVVADPDNTIASIMTTSGTSGLPKGALMSHSYHTSQAALRNGDLSLPYEIRRLIALPPFHTFATPLIPSALRAGHTSYIMRRYDERQFIEAIEKYHITETYMPPPVLTGIPQSPLATKDGLRSLRQIWTGGAGVKYANQLPLYDLLDESAQINLAWGMTEVGWATATLWPDKQTDDGCGRPLAGFKLRIVDDNEVEVAKEGDVGNILIYGPHITKGYIGNEEATRDTFTSDGYLRTGDVGYLVDGKIFIIDRKKELLKVRGWQVSPAEVEGILVQHPDVLDAAVIGVPSDNTEIPRAYIVRAQGSTVTDAELKRFVSEKLARYKIPEQIVFTDAIPKNSTGKILRRVLRDNLKNETTQIQVIPVAEEKTSRSWKGDFANWLKGSNRLSKAIKEALEKFDKEFKTQESPNIVNPNLHVV